MQRFVRALVIGLAVAMGAAGAHAAMKMTPMVEDMIEHHIAQLQKWTADPVIVKAVSEQNQRGPLAGMDNGKWKEMRRRDPMIMSFRSNEASQFLEGKQEASKGMISQLVLSAAAGETVAFTKKPTQYLSKGAPEFDTPLHSGNIWRGEPIFDPTIQTHVLPVAAPVLVDGKPAGVLVIAIQLGHMEKMNKTHMHR